MGLYVEIGGWPKEEVALNLSLLRRGKMGVWSTGVAGGGAGCWLVAARVVTKGHERRRSRGGRVKKRGERKEKKRKGRGERRERSVKK